MPVRAASIAGLARKTHEVVALGQRPEGWKETTVEKWMEEEMDQSFSTIKSYLKCARSPSDIAEVQGHRRVLTDIANAPCCLTVFHGAGGFCLWFPQFHQHHSGFPRSGLRQAEMPVPDPAKSHGDASCVSVSREPSP